ncbi:hypothetical protein PhCBS80983_g00086 [Powellomyces hirtus]|uniref:MYND-type domain-containing protein n=1 Tax=Powellomyces hirtus TaxID=109895 RepID=A0A507EHG8_9FUNG|nr:hypothetical protein PhCBS80983_g00086 [Powellomyces hirtus]
MTPIPTNAAGKKRRAVLVTKACKAGDEIFHEEAVVSVPTSTEGIICSYCLTSLPAEAEAATQCEKCKTEHYCGSACETKAKDEYHTVLCSESQAGRALEEYCAEKRTVIPLLVGRFLMKMVKEENKKKEGKTKGPGKYSDWDHLERLFDLPRKPTEEATAEADQEVKLLKAAIAPHVPGFEDFLTTDRYASIKGKLTYNSFGITSSNPSAMTTVHLVDTPRGPTVPVAIGHYRTAPLIAHNCTPSATMTHKGDTTSIIAAKDLEAGDEVTLDWASVAEMDTSARRKILKERFAFFCRCETCAPTSANSVVENVAA